MVALWRTRDNCTYDEGRQMADFNPRYTIYARMHGRTEEEMSEYDKARFPGGCMTGFILWISEKKAGFYMQHPEAFIDRHTIWDHAAWDRYLESLRLPL